MRVVKPMTILQDSYTKVVREADDDYSGATT